MPPFVKKSVERRPTALGVHIFAGGFTVGVKAAGFDVLAHLEDTDYGVATAKANWPDLDVRVGSENWSPEEFAGRTDLLVSNPPCAIFSSAGISTTRGPEAWREDPRLGCWYRAFRVFDVVRPKVFALESVCQAYTKGREVVDAFTLKATANGYSVVHLLIDAKWTGLPQSRKRFFFVAYRPELDLRFDFDFADPPSVGEVLASVGDDPGEYECGKSSKGRANPSQWIPQCRPGERLSDVFDRTVENPTRNAQGKVSGRPSFNCRRLRHDETMGAFIGNFYAHPEQDRFVGTREMRALCGYPQDFWLEGSPGGHASLLARAVMPNVGEWLATSVRAAMAASSVDYGQTVTVVDLRRPGLDAIDLTASYADSDSSSTLDSCLETSIAVAQRDSRRPTKTSRRSDPEPIVSSPTVRDDGDPERPKIREGSGEFIRRLWMTGQYSPERLVELVHANWEGRTTRVNDVYYNYKKLVEAGTADVPPWPKKVVTRTPQPRETLGTATIRRFDGYGKPTLLLTGSTPMQVGSKKTQLKIVTAASCWAAAFESMGYAVDWRAVTPGEDLSAYDAVVACLNKPNSITSNYFHGAAWALSQRSDAVVAIDDWQVGELISGLQTCARSAERLFRLRGSDIDQRTKTIVHETVISMTERWQRSVLVPVLGDGDVSLLGIPSDVVVSVDPTPFALRYDRTYAGSKEKRWVQASLLRKPLTASTWPVEGYGNSDHSEGGIGPAGENAQPRLPESELFTVYERAWGVISPAHPHAGSGWWRVRYLMAADAGCVLNADPAEAACLGDPYLKASDRSAVERLGEIGLRSLASAQRRRLAEVAWTADRVRDSLTDLLRIATATA